MEENKVVEMRPQTTKEKMSYEELNNAAIQLSEQNRKMYMQLQEVNMVNMFKRLEFLFKVIENQGSFSSEFVIKCVEEVEDIMTIPTEDKDSE
jgi:hypothetical protein